MKFRAHFRQLLHLTCLAIALCGAAALAQDPPGRVGRVNHAEGTVTFAPAGDDEWMDAPRNRPLTRGDRLWTDRGSRAEIQVGSTTIRLDGLTRLEIVELDDHSTKLSLTQGSANVRVRALPEGENFEIDTPNLAHRAAYPGDYRIDVDAGLGTTRVTIHSGAGTVYGEAGQAQSLGGGQQVTFRGRTLTQLEARESPPQDAFDRWATERNRREDQSIAARYLPREVVGYQELDPHGQWLRDPSHGSVWVPQGVPTDWAPYRHGRWEWLSPWGWTWIDDAPWGFAPFHYGRWTLLADRWAWVPGRLSQRPVYAPALVAFVGGSRGIVPGASGSDVAWFPLAPGEMWQPGFRASMAYISNVNRHMVPGQGDASYAYQRRREALTAISREDFHRGRPVAAGWLRVAAITLTNASVVPPPPMPERSAVASRERAPVARSAPPAPQVRQVTADAAPVPAPAAPPVTTPVTTSKSSEQNKAAAKTPAAAAVAAATPAPAASNAGAMTAPGVRKPPATAVSAPSRQQAEQQARAEATRRAEAAQARAQASAAAARQAATARAEALRREQQQEARRAEAQKREQALAAQSRRDQAQRAEQARRQQVAQAEQIRREQAAARAEEIRRDQAAARAEQGKRSQLAKREQLARREQQARQADEARAEAIAKRKEQQRREAVVRREEQQRREAVARREEQQRREAVARRDEQQRREAVARRDEQFRREARAAQVEQARRAADREAQALRQQRTQRDEQARRAAQDREQALREASQREQQAIAEQWRRDQQAWEQQQQQQQRPRPRPRPDLRPDWRDDARDRPPEVWQRGIPILNPGRTS